MAFIFHITHLDNLSKILEGGNLWCDNEKAKRVVQAKGIAHENIKARRARKIVPACVGGSLADYVPFYFAQRSPMLCAIHNRRVVNYNGGQNLILHLFSTVEKVVERDLPFTFTDGHAEMATSKFYEEVADLDKIDWEIMRAQVWRDTEDDGDRKRRRQAEFLVYNHFPIDLINGIGVISESIKNRVEQILNQANIQTKVVVKPHWYYS
jgi:hypothetical protein